MRVNYCEETGDIFLILTRKEAIEVKRVDYKPRGGYTPCLEAKANEQVFCLTNSNPRNGDFIGLKEPRSYEFPYWYIKISDRAYEALMRDGRAGTRIVGDSKVSIILEESLDKW